MSEPFLPYGRQNITDEDIEAVSQALRSDFLTTGPKVAEFERLFATYVGAQHSVAVANGTAALHLASMVLDINPGDIVLAPTMSFAASANGAAYCGAHIRFIDCNPDSGLITPETFKQAVLRCENEGALPKTAVIVHLSGEVADIEAISMIANEYGIALIEDCCHGLGSQYLDSKGNTQTVGNCAFSQLSCFSTHPVKTMTTGEGGLITTNDNAMAERLVKLRMHGMVRDPDQMIRTEFAISPEGLPNPWYYEIQELGYNYRLTDFACALGISQLKRMDQISKNRKRIKETYDRLFAEANLPLHTISTQNGHEPVRHLYPILVDFEELGFSRASFMAALKEKNIGTQVHYVPTHLFKIYENVDQNVSFDGAMKYYERTVSIPMYPRKGESV